ncbi:MAG TPA: chorismate synthase, partial [Clostridiales bacterium]|nr:chorismate synthase [Clostridiales bacterium]
MSFEYGRNLRVTLFGQSHAAAIGCVIDGLPAGEKIDEEAIRAFMKRRAPGGDLATSRTEPDEALVVSGLVNGRTCGSPVCAVIENRDVRSGDYETIADTPRPSHADYTAHVKYRGFNDKRGGGHFSGRMTAPLCFAGAVCMQVLGRLGVEVGCHIARIGPVEDSLFDAVDVGAEQLARLRAMAFPVLDAGAGEKMKREIAAAAAEKDSVG